MNKVMLIGNVGKDPDVRYYEADQAVAQVSLATTERGYTLQNGTQVPDHTDWHNLVFYRNLAKIVEKYVKKGDKLKNAISEALANPDTNNSNIAMTKAKSTPKDGAFKCTSLNVSDRNVMSNVSITLIKMEVPCCFRLMQCHHQSCPVRLWAWAEL